MAQLRYISRPLSQLNPFVVNAAQPVQNPISRGFDYGFRVDWLTFECEAEIALAGAPGTVVLGNRVELDSILNAMAVNVRLFSSTYGDIIRSLTLAQLNKATEYLSGERVVMSGLNGIGINSITGLGATPAGSVTVNLKIRIPFNLIKHRTRAAHAPRVMGFQDGGLSYTTGTGLCTIGGLVGTVNAAASSISWYLEGPTNTKIVKTSPLLYEVSNFNALQGQEHPAGLYYLLLQDTDNASAVFGAAGGVASGWRMFIDGENWVEMNDTDPMNAVEDCMRGLGGAEAWRFAAGVDGTVNQESTFNVPGIPIIRTPYTSRSWDLAVASQRIVTDLGVNYTAACNYLSVRVIPTNQVPDVSQCPCGPGGSRAAPLGMPGEGGGTSTAVAPYAPQSPK